MLLLALLLRRLRAAIVSFHQHLLEPHLLAELWSRLRWLAFLLDAVEFDDLGTVLIDRASITRGGIILVEMSLVKGSESLNRG